MSISLLFFSLWYTKHNGTRDLHLPGPCHGLQQQQTSIDGQELLHSLSAHGCDCQSFYEPFLLKWKFTRISAFLFNRRIYYRSYLVLELLRFVPLLSLLRLFAAFAKSVLTGTLCELHCSLLEGLVWYTNHGSPLYTSLCIIVVTVKWCGWDLNFAVKIYNFLTILSLQSDFSGPTSSSMRVQRTHRA